MRLRPLYWRLYHSVWGFKLTPTGRAFVLGVLLSAVGSVSLEIPIYRIFCLLIVMIGAAEIVGWLWKPRLEALGRIPARVSTGDQFAVPVDIRNVGWKAAYDIMAGVVPAHPAVAHVNSSAYIPRIGRGESAELPIIFLATRRGVHHLPDVNLHTTFPLNLMRYRAAALPETTITVVPAFRRIDHFDLPFSTRYQHGGVMMSSGLGHSPEYIGNREYTPGEPVRRLDFRAWARTGKPVVREFQEEYYCRIALVLDTYVTERPRKNAAYPPFEAAVSLMAAISDALDVNEYLIDLFAAGPEFHLFRTIGGSNRLEAVLDILAAVDVSRANPFREIAPRIADELEQISTAVCVFLDWDDVREEFCQRVLEAGCLLKIVIVRDGPTTMPVSIDGTTVVSTDAVFSGQVREL